MTHPFIPLYVDDFDAATAHLSPEEDGIYNRLLRLSWRTAGCSIPADSDWIARKIRVSPEDFERVGVPLLAEYFSLRNGRWVQPRLKREYEAITRKLNARREAGKKGGSAKALKGQAKSPSNARVLLQHTRASPEPYPELEEELTLFHSESKDSAASGDPDFNKEAWDRALALLGASGVAEKAARGFIGRLISANGVRAADLLPAIMSAQIGQSGDPAAYLTKAAQGIARRRRAPADGLTPAERALRSNIQ